VPIRTNKFATITDANGVDKATPLQSAEIMLEPEQELLYVLVQ
jgi:hypothetical protein